MTPTYTTPPGPAPAPAPAWEGLDGGLLHQEGQEQRHNQKDEPVPHVGSSSRALGYVVQSN